MITDINTAMDSHRSLMDNILKGNDYIKINQHRNEDEISIQDFSDSIFSAYGMSQLIKNNPEKIVERISVSEEWGDFDETPYYRAHHLSTFKPLDDSMSSYFVEIHRRPEANLSEGCIQTLIENFFSELYKSNNDWDDENETTPNKHETMKFSQGVIQAYAILYASLKSMTVLHRDTETGDIVTLKSMKMIQKAVLRQMPKTTRVKPTDDMFSPEGFYDFENLFGFHQSHRFTEEDIEYFITHDLNITINCYIEMFKIHRSCTFKYNKNKECFELIYKDSQSMSQPSVSKENKEYKTYTDINEQIEEIESYKVSSFSIHKSKDIGYFY